jgi:hypothetical protein
MEKIALHTIKASTGNAIKVGFFQATETLSKFRKFRFNEVNLGNGLTYEAPVESPRRNARVLL